MSLTPNIALLGEGDFQHVFPLIAMRRVLPRAPVWFTGERNIQQIPGSEHVKTQDLPQHIKSANIDVILSTSQLIDPAPLQSAGARVVHIGHGESDKTHGSGRSPARSFAQNEINRKFDMACVARHSHKDTHLCAHTVLVGALKHDVFHHDPRYQKPPENLILWAPGWGRHNATGRWLEPVVDHFSDSPYQLVLHPHPFSYRAEPLVIQRAQALLLSTPNFRIAQTTNILTLMARAQLLLCDVSSVCYDWLLFDRPMVFLDHAGLHIEEEKKLFPCGLVASHADSLASTVEKALKNLPAQQTLRRKQLAEDFYSLDGKAAERVRDAVLHAWNQLWN